VGQCVGGILSTVNEQIAIARADGIALTIAVLKRHSDNAAVCDAACSLLRALAENRVRTTHVLIHFVPLFITSPPNGTCVCVNIKR